MAPEATHFADVETSSADYATRFAGPWGAWLLDRQSEVVTELLAGRHPATALDVGGGHGQLVEPLGRSGARVTIVGSSVSCGELIAPLRAASTIDFCAAPLIPLPFADDSFDIVTCIRLLTHCDRWRELVGEICRVARDLVIIDYPPLLSFNVLTPGLFHLKKLIEGNTRTYTIFTHQQIDDAFRQHGFVAERRIGQFFWPMGAHRLIKKPQLSERAERFARAAGLTTLFGSPTLAAFRPAPG